MLQRISQWDYAVSSLCLGHRFNAQVASCARVISHSADGYYYAVFAVLLAYTPYATPFVHLAAPAFAVELSCYLILKQLFRRDRPQSLPVFIRPSDRFSFPSGHSAGAYVMAACIAQTFPTWTVLAFVWASLVACSRVLLGVHFISDVLAGAGLGLLIVYGIN